MAVNSAPPSEELFVTGLPMDSTSEMAKQIFSQYGSVKETTVLPVSPGKQAAAGFVVMNSIEDARWIVEHVNGNVPQGAVRVGSSLLHVESLSICDTCISCQLGRPG